MRRRDFIAGAAGAAAWPFSARAQQPALLRRIGVLMGFSEPNFEARRWVEAFERKLTELGWKEGIDLHIEYRWPGNPADRLRADAAEIVNLNPDAILVSNEPTLAFTAAATRTIPIVFANVTNANLGRHHGNITGIVAIEPEVAEKWISVLKDLVPGIERVGILNEVTAPKEFFQHLEVAAASHGLELIPTAEDRESVFRKAREAAETGDTTAARRIIESSSLRFTLEAKIAQFAAEPNGGLVVLPSFVTTVLRSRIIAAVARYRVPAIYGHRFFAAEGGLISYGTDIARSFAQAALYIDRLLKGETPADLPLQPPSQYDLVPLLSQH